MKAWRLFAAVIGQALRNLVEQRRLHLLALTVMALSLSVLGAFVMVASNLAQVRDRIGGERVLTAFVAASVEGAKLTALREQVLALPGIERVEALDVTAATESFRQALGPHGALLDDLGPDVIPAALVVHAAAGTTTDGMAELARQLSGLVGVEEVAYAMEEVRRLSALIRIVELTALAIGGLIILVTIIIISNTIRLTVMARQEEIAILKLVGATDAYVRLPFVIEGLVGGLLAGGAAVGIVWVLGAAVTSAMTDIASGAFGIAAFVTLSSQNALLLVFAGGALGLTGGLVSVGRFLKEP